MTPLTQWPIDQRRDIAGVLTDIDDTLTRDGAIEPAALEALERLRAAGLPVIAITGRPTGWSEGFAREWPLQAIVAENGAVALVPDGSGTVRRLYQQDAATRAANFQRLQAAARHVLREVPEARLATDSWGRETDIAIDHAEHHPLPPEAVDRVADILRGEGLRVTVSSIHVNAWFGAHDKLAGARWIVRELMGRELDAEISRWVYVGDSTNDQVMFEHFPRSVGVANIARFWNQLQHRPRWVTSAERGAGFAEVVAAILAARGGECTRPPGPESELPGGDQAA